MSNINKICPVCNSSYMFRIIDVPTRRTKINIPLYLCIDCRSMCNPSGYSEDDEQLARDLQWNISVADRNRNAAGRLLVSIQNTGLNPKSALEIGAGIGTILHEFENTGLKVRGYDINSQATSYGTKEYGIDLRCEFWNADTDIDHFDLLLSISVLEHLNEPRHLLEEISIYCNKHRSKAFISVPFVNRDQWNFLLNPDPYVPDTPFFDNDVHVTHFSNEGMERCLHDFGAIDIQFLEAGLWQGYLVGF